ncbi:MAG: hypothetical protein ABIQ16_11895 [Polyangiaceae bacterium]
MAFRWAVTIALSSGLLSASCSTSTCSRDEDEFTVSNGITIGNSYQSGPYKTTLSAPGEPLKERFGPYVYFPPNRTITFEHHLGQTPLAPQIYVAFYDDGTLAPAAGNQALLRGMDDQVIQIKNDLCSDLYVWLTAEVPALPAPVQDGDTGGEAGAAP